MSYAVVIPCYRSASMLPDLVRRVLDVMRQEAEDFSVILVVDGSPDDTWAVARELANEHAAVR
ncbi:MAG TPA: glycosyltransferase, partial [Aeromicrobium sp.]|nr:glycosyltransferase [Aeromicrobium sp.]